MQTKIHPDLEGSPGIGEAERILRSCVHCGFCNATCPTYLELGDERDGPRGRIYLIKQLLETGTASALTQKHLDRCLTCRSCETTCPSGVEYGRLADLGRGLIEAGVERGWRDRLLRSALRRIVARPKLFAAVLAGARLAKPVLPARLRAKVPGRHRRLARPAPRHARRMLVLEGCAQSAATPATNDAAAGVLDRLGISLVTAPRARCCGALSYHLGAQGEGLGLMRANIDAWWPSIEAGAEAIVISASGCGVTVKEYGYLLRDDPDYAARAQRVSELAKDLSEVVGAEDLSALETSPGGVKLAVHAPCTLTHGQGLSGNVEKILASLGFSLAATKEGHLCCGSAGSYSVLEPELAERLRKRKLEALTGDAPQLIVTANVGCQLHLAAASRVPVRHWIELL